LARPYVIALVVAGILAAVLPVAGHLYSWHSTPVFWAAGINFPGVIIATWLSLLVRHQDFKPLDYAVVALSNWGFYSLIIWGVQKLKRRRASS
jgi:hypothetical protein